MPQPTTTGGGLMGYPSSVDTGYIAPAIVSNEGANLPGALTQALSANTVYLYTFELQAGITIVSATWHMGATVTGKTNMGIYTLAGSLVAGSDTGQVTNVASSDNTFTYSTPILLSAGQYLMALAPNNSTDTYLARSSGANTAPYRGRKATNGLSAGALPSTTGILGTISTQPACSLNVQGGL